jgi:hypothetical protein
MYRNFSTPKGLALVFNNREFDKMPHRHGTDVDAKNITQLLTKLGYVVKVKENHTTKDMQHALARFALKTEHNRYDSAIVVVLTHGEHGEVFK